MKIIFHHPLPLNYQATSASGIRPIKMLKAFESLGCEVFLVAGYSHERKAAIREVKKHIESGVNYDLVYSESSTMPTLLTDTHHLPLNPTVDFEFFAYLKKQKIPIGLFYRDIYWLFDEYSQNLPYLKAQFAKFFYRYDIKKYDKYLDKLYLPSMEMARYVPAKNRLMLDALPPGHAVDLTCRSIEPKSPLKINLLYIGGLSNHYQMHELFKALATMPDVEFTLCTREAEWLAVRDEYPEPSTNITIVHKNGAELKKLFDGCTLAMLFVKPQEYREFAAPVKLYEYLGHGKPIIATEGTLAGRFVSENGIGWTISYTANALKELLSDLAENPDTIRRAVEAARRVAESHTWRARAEKVITDLKG